MSKKPIYFYGDSFTAGHGLLPPLVYKEHPEPEGSQHFTYKLKEYFKADKAYYRATAGNTNDHILFQLTEDLPLITSGSTIIVGLSAPTRSSIYLHKTKNSSLEYSIMAKKGVNKVLSKKSKLIPVNIHLPDSDNSTFDKKTLLANNASSDFIEAMDIAGTYNALVKGQYFGEWTIYWRTVIIGILDSAKRLGINVVLWDWTSWSYYESLMDATDGKIQDYHWSWKGQSDFYYDLIAAYEKDKYIYDLYDTDVIINVEQRKAKVKEMEYRRAKFIKENS